MADDGNKKKDTRRKRRKVESDTDAGIHVLFSSSRAIFCSPTLISSKKS